MGSNNGTGQPYWFRCSKCRSTVRGGDGGWSGQVELTGRKRRARSIHGGPRVCPIEREYRCLSCDHVGWSRHVDLADKAGESEYLMLDDDGNLHLPSYASKAAASSRAATPSCQGDERERQPSAASSAVPPSSNPTGRRI